MPRLLDGELGRRRLAASLARTAGDRAHRPVGQVQLHLLAGERAVAAGGERHARARQAADAAVRHGALGGRQVRVGRRPGADGELLDAGRGDDADAVAHAARAAGARPVGERLGDLGQVHAPGARPLAEHRQRLLRAVRLAHHQAQALQRRAGHVRLDLDAVAVDDLRVARPDGERIARVGRVVAVRIGHAGQLDVERARAEQPEREDRAHHQQHAAQRVPQRAQRLDGILREAAHHVRRAPHRDAGQRPRQQRLGGRHVGQVEAGRHLAARAGQAVHVAGHRHRPRRPPHRHRRRRERADAEAQRRRHPRYAQARRQVDQQVHPRHREQAEAQQRHHPAPAPHAGDGLAPAAEVPQPARQLPAGALPSQRIASFDGVRHQTSPPRRRTSQVAAMTAARLSRKMVRSQAGVFWNSSGCCSCQCWT